MLRLTANNPGPLTGPGTNSYVVAPSAGGAAAVIDPGPDDADHRAALMDAAGGPSAVAAVLATHAHLDHSAGAAAFAAAVNAPLYGFGPHGSGRRSAFVQLLKRLGDDPGAAGGGEGADRRYKPDRALEHGQPLGAPGANWTLRAIHTPGHIADHLCFALEPASGGAAAAVFSGDHVMAWATSLVSPPDGDMRAYMDSLALMARRRDPLLLPGHGEPVEDPAARVAELIAHRRGRRDAILAALGDGPRRSAEIRAAVYLDLPKGLEPAAERNVLAHLLELIELGHARPFDPFSPTARFEAV